MSWTIPGQGYLREVYLEEAIKLKWKETNRDNPQRFETTHKGQKITLEWFKGPTPGPKINLKGAHMHIKSENQPAGPAAIEVANAVAKHFAGQRIIQQNGKIVSKGRSDKNFTTYRPGWRGTWNPGWQKDWKFK